MPTLLPTDSDSNVIPAVRLKDGGAHAIAATDTSAINDIAFDSDTRIVSLYATGPVYIRFGDENAEATTEDHYFPDGIYYDFAIGGGRVAQAAHVAVIRAEETDCVLYVSEKE